MIQEINGKTTISLEHPPESGEVSMSQVRPLFVPVPYQDAADSGRLILKDGSTASLRVARPGDCDDLYAFFQRLSPESRWRRFFSLNLPSMDLISRLCTNNRRSD